MQLLGDKKHAKKYTLNVRISGVSGRYVLYDGGCLSNSILILMVSFKNGQDRNLFIDEITEINKRKTNC